MSAEFAVQLPQPGELAAVASRVAKLVATPMVPVLAGVVLTATEDTLTVSGFTGDVLLRTEITAAVDAPGTVIVAARLLGEVTKTLPRDRNVSLQLQGTHLVLSCGQSTTRLPVLPVEDYPPTPQAPPVLGHLDGGELSAGLAATAHAVGCDGAELTTTSGLYLELDPAAGRARFQATDRFRLAVREVTYTPIEQDQEPRTLRVAHGPLADVLRTAQAGHPVALAADEARIALAGQHTELVLGQLDNARPPRFSAVLPAEAATLRVQVAELTQATKRAAVFRSKDTARAVLDFTDEEITVSTEAAETGAHTESVPVTDPDGEIGIRVGMNAINLGQALAVLGADEALVTVPSAPSRPLQLQPLDADGLPDDTHRQLVVPMKLPAVPD